MKLIHLSDLHLGKMLHRVSLLRSGDQPVWVDRFLSSCDSLRPDAVAISGDVYDRSAPPAEAVALLSRLLTGLTDRGIQVLLIPGNHDSAQRLAFGRELLGREGLHIAPALTPPGRLSRVTLEDPFGPVDLWLMPYLFPALAAEALGMELGDYDAAVRALLAHQSIDFSRRNVLLAHQNVTLGGLETERGGSETTVGGVGQVDVSAFDGFDYVALGHIHAGYALSPSVRYAGSPLCYHFNETRQREKGPLLVELGEKGTPPSVKLVPIAPLHRMRMAEGSYETLCAAEAARTEGNEYVSLTLTDRRVTPEISEDLHSILEAKGSILMELRSRWQADPGQAALSASALGELGLAALFADFYTQRCRGAEPEAATCALLCGAEALAERADCTTAPTADQIDQFLELALKEAD